jgi:hypothetical protein
MTEAHLHSGSASANKCVLLRGAAPLLCGLSERVKIVQEPVAKIDTIPDVLVHGHFFLCVG